MAYSTQRAVSNGTLGQLALSLDYFDRSEITVLFNGIVSPPSSGKWAWVGTTDKTISFTPVVANGVEVTVRRDTQLAAPLHQYTRGAQFIASTLDDNFQQVLRIAQEAREGAGATDVYNDVDYHGYRLKNVGAAIAPNDAVSLAQYQADAGGAAASKDAAAASALQAFGYANTAFTERAAAQTASSNAAASASQAFGYANTAFSERQAAQTAATNAAGSAGSAATSLSDLKDRYYGPAATAPTVRYNGAALQPGDLYFDTGLNVMRVRNSSGWQTLPAAATGGLEQDFAARNLVAVSFNGGQLAGLRNRIINGACRINQRGAVAVAVSPAAAGYGGPDRYSYLSVNSTGAGFTVASGSLVYNGRNKATIRHTINTPATTLSGGSIIGGIAQVIEGINCYDLYLKPVTLSFIFNTTVAGTYSVSLRDGSSSYSYVSSFVASANTPVKVQIVIPACPAGMTIPPTSAPGLVVNIAALNDGTYKATTLNAWTVSNTLFAFGSVAWASVANAYIEATEIQLEEGPVATPFEHRPHGVELTLCQRYYEVARAHILANAAGVGAYVSARTYYRVTKRAPPTVVVNQLSAAGLTTPVVALQNTTDGVTLYSTATAASNYLEFVGDVVADSEL